MKTYSLILLSGVSASLAAGEYTHDPRERDESIYLTEVRVEINTLSSGHYEYIYSVQSSNRNKGFINTFQVDIACDTEMSSVEFYEPNDPKYRGDYSRDKKHVPAQVHGKYGNLVRPAISVMNTAFWGVGIPPGNSASGGRIVSPRAPALRSYVLTPGMDTYGWDYETHPDGKWIPDFVVEGAIEGPSCPSVPDGRFLGWSAQGKEFLKTNRLLSYSQPLSVDNVMEHSRTTATLTIYYANTVNVKTFEVAPAGLRPHFDPVPGTHQTVTIDLKDLSRDKNTGTLVLSVLPVDDRKPMDTIRPLGKDVDLFRFHVD